jgi:hypothetical protein
MPLSPHNSVVLETKAHIGPNLRLGSASLKVIDNINFCNFLKLILEDICVKFSTSFSVATLALGSQPEQKVLQRCGPRERSGITSHTPGSVGKCEGVNPHTLKATPTLGDGVLVDSQNFKE